MNAHKCPCCGNICWIGELVLKCSVCGNIDAKEMGFWSGKRKFTLHLCSQCEKDWEYGRGAFEELANFISNFIESKLQVFDYLNPVTGTSRGREMICVVCEKPAWAIKEGLLFCQKHRELIEENTDEIAKIQP